MTRFHVAQIDHVEIFVPDQYEAARWYQAVLGLEILPQYEHWAATGPLMISSDNGSTMLALFVGEPRGDRPTAGHHRVAFRMDAAGFLDFYHRMTELPVYNDAGKRIDVAKLVDHDQSYSIYFCDPYGNRYEVTTYEYDLVADVLARSMP